MAAGKANNSKAKQSKAKQSKANLGECEYLFLTVAFAMPRCLQRCIVYQRSGVARDGGWQSEKQQSKAKQSKANLGECEYMFLTVAFAMPRRLQRCLVYQRSVVARDGGWQSEKQQSEAKQSKAKQI